MELFNSLGCIACTAANALVADLADRKDVLALTFPVDYWDYLGWKDTFARPEFFPVRQRAYMKGARSARGVYPPGGGERRRRAPRPTASAVDKAPDLIKVALKAAPPEPDIRLSHGRVAVGSGPAPEGGADVWLVRYESQPQETEVKAGENRGVMVVYRNVAVGLQRLGVWSGRSQGSMPCPRPRPAARRRAGGWPSCYRPTPEAGFSAP